MNALMSFCMDLQDGRGPLLAQGIRDYADPLISEVNEEVVSACRIRLPFAVKPEFDVDTGSSKKRAKKIRLLLQGF